MFCRRICLVGLSLLLLSTTTAREISLQEVGEYQQLFNMMEYQGTVSFGDVEKRRCVRYDKGTYFAVAPACFLQGGILPDLSFTQAIDALFPFVEDVSQIYNSDVDAFRYDTTQLIFSEEIETIQKSAMIQDLSVLQLFAHHNIMIQVPKSLLAYEQIHDYAFFASIRDTTTYGPCRKKNYDVAMRELDGYVLQPGARLNMNKLIANLPDYCTGTKGKFLFYQGVCGGSTQLFWNALVNPYVYVTERHAHGEFWTSFYGHKGEDAAIYEWSKQLIVENIGNAPVYYRTFVGPDGNTVLLSAYPRNEGLWSFVQKHETGPLSAELVNKVTDTHGSLKYEQSRISQYRGVNETKDL